MKLRYILALILVSVVESSSLVPGDDSSKDSLTLMHPIEERKGSSCGSIGSDASNGSEVMKPLKRRKRKLSIDSVASISGASKVSATASIKLAASTGIVPDYETYLKRIDEYYEKL
jgi:hypothetical protein